MYMYTLAMCAIVFNVKHTIYNVAYCIMARMYFCGKNLFSSKRVGEVPDSRHAVFCFYVLYWHCTTHCTVAAGCTTRIALYIVQ